MQKPHRESTPDLTLPLEGAAHRPATTPAVAFVAKKKWVVPKNYEKDFDWLPAFKPDSFDRPGSVQLWFCQKLCSYIERECLPLYANDAERVNQLTRLSDEVRIVANLIRQQIRALKVVFIGEGGVGTTTAVCSLFGLLDRNRVPLLPTGAGGSSLSDFVLDSGAIAVQIEALPENKLDHLLGTLHSSRGPASVLLAAQNMCNMKSDEFRALIKAPEATASTFIARLKQEMRIHLRTQVVYNSERNTTLSQDEYDFLLFCVIYISRD